MKKGVLGVAAIVALATLVFAGLGSAAPDENVKPRCADIIGGSGGYFPGEPPEVEFTVRLAEPSCSNVAYTIVVLDDATNTTPLATATQQGDGTSTSLLFTINEVANDDDTICVYATTSKAKKNGGVKEGKLYDRAPDTGCLEITAGVGPGGSDFN